MVIERAKRVQGSTSNYASLILRCFTSDTLKKLDAIKRVLAEEHDGTATADLCWLALVSILRSVSPVGTAQWQYVLPKKSKSAVADPFDAFAAQISLMARDMNAAREHWVRAPTNILLGDARDCRSVPDRWADLIITSPPYANNYDYADATRLEMCFLGEIAGWSDLQLTIRDRLLRSCTQHVASYAHETDDVIASDEVVPIRNELSEVCRRLERERHRHGGRKPYHAMVAHYFLDLAKVWQSLRRITRLGATVCFVVGDSAPYGIHVPVDRWLGDLAIAAGFKSCRFEKLRDRNVKWRNRKHRVPLHEGLLWVNG
jgi:hypothetical protein